MTATQHFFLRDDRVFERVVHKQDRNVKILRMTFEEAVRDLRQHLPPVVTAEAVA